MTELGTTSVEPSHDVTNSDEASLRGGTGGGNATRKRIITSVEPSPGVTTSDEASLHGA